MTISFRTNGRHGYAVKFSPYFGHRLLCASSQHYGIAGTCQGSLFILDFSATGIKVIGRWEWAEGLFDCSWSENNPDFCVTASGDGSLQMVFKEHTAEWDPSAPQSLGSFCDHQHVVYSAVWSPHISGTFASVSGDNTLKIWDISAPPHAQQTIRAHNGEVLTCDWARYDPNLLFTGSVDKRIRFEISPFHNDDFVVMERNIIIPTSQWQACIFRGWDLRNTVAPVIDLEGHQYAVRRVKCSPHNRSLLASCSYDFTIRTWNINNSRHPLESIEHHTEFVVGLDFNLHLPGQLADCSWDEYIKIHTPASLC
ncbi:Peroxisomal targeting signal 2 receptor [Acropora cervicornis]|uniref:Peroxin-7 n=1 Tax=Acropora cervicornis TaxID=6130 RepID=A0AAD9PWP3_ACRCE|nr:Peroxisomal targeting signal 2 receptor [Acropora cervicornis]